jgi:hypothetical protein
MARVGYPGMRSIASLRMVAQLARLTRTCCSIIQRGQRAIVRAETAIILLSVGKPELVAFSGVPEMRAWLHARGLMTGSFYTKMNVPLNPR